MEPRPEPNTGYRLMRAIYPVLRVLLPHQVIRVDDLAQVMVNVSVRATAERYERIFENREIQAMAESLAETAPA